MKLSSSGMTLEAPARRPAGLRRGSVRAEVAVRDERRVRRSRGVGPRRPADRRAALSKSAAPETADEPGPVIQPVAEAITPVAPVAAEPSDEALVDRLRQGDAAAGEALARRYHEPLVRFLTWLAGGPHPVDDLFQQTWLSVLTHLDHFDLRSGSGGFRAWLFRIATNKVNDRWRNGGRERAAVQGLKLITDSEAPHASHGLELTEQDRQLRAAMADLSDKHREVLMLRFYGKMKFTEIADTLGLPLNTALGRVHKALKKLRQIMEQE